MFTEGKQILAQLPMDHPKRNTPLVQIKAQARIKGSALEEAWRDIARFRISSSTFNQLSSNWTDCTEFRG